ncbi:MAG: 5-methyltetrahydropteroyltriglutamate--homocysteine S-methyltransferase, partial [Corynebacterium variabile]
MTAQINATVAGVPRIGPKRELKKALETYWKDASTGRNLATVATQLVNQQADQLTAAGLDSVPTIGRSFYDAMLDTSALLGALPARVADIDDHDNDGLPAFVDRLFAAARGTAELPASAMTKWFDTNYHYIVPELAADTEFRLDDAALLADLHDQITRGTAARPVLIGPLTYLALARTTDGSDALTHLEEVFDAYARLLPRIAERGAAWVQFDEPYLVTDVDADEDRKADLLARTRAGYGKLAAATDLNILLQTYFGDGDLAIKTLTGTGIAAFGVDLVRALETLKALAARGPVGVSTSASLLHVPYSLAQETSLDNDPELRSWLAFGAEKIAEVALLDRALRGEESEGDDAAVAEAHAAVASRKNSERTRNAALRQRTAAITEADRHRNPFDQRREVQERELNLPPLPTTTIGSFPQTAEIRAARAKLRTG